MLKLLYKKYQLTHLEIQNFISLKKCFRVKVTITACFDTKCQALWFGIIEANIFNFFQFQMQA